MKFSTQVGFASLTSITLASQHSCCGPDCLATVLTGNPPTYQIPQVEIVKPFFPVYQDPTSPSTVQTRLVKRSPVPGQCCGKLASRPREEAQVEEESESRQGESGSPSQADSSVGQGRQPTSTALDQAHAYGVVAQDHRNEFGSGLELFNDLAEHGEEAAGVREEVAQRALGNLLAGSVARQDRRAAVKKVQWEELEMATRERDRMNLQLRRERDMADLAAQRAARSHHVAD